MAKRKLFDWEVRIIRRCRQIVEHKNEITKKHPYSVQSLAKRFGVSANIISNVANKKTYRNVPEDPAPGDLDRAGEFQLGNIYQRNWNRPTESDIELATTSFTKGARR